MDRRSGRRTDSPGALAAGHASAVEPGGTAPVTGAGTPIGIVLLNLGGPPDQAAVQPFLYRLFSDREIIQLPGGPLGQKLLARLIARARGREVRRNYRAIGGGSPILSLTTAQARALETALNRPAERPETGVAAGSPPDGRHHAGANGTRFAVSIAMRYWHPTSDEALTGLVERGISRAVALTLYPQYSTATTGSSWNELLRAARRLGLESRLRLSCIDRYPIEPAYLEAVAATVLEGLARFPEELRSSVVLLFSAHGLPVRFIERGDPYEREIHATRDGVLAHLRRHGVENRWELAYQSRTGPVRWLDPSTDVVIRELGQQKVRSVLVIPIAFVSDHIETLYEVDQLFAEEARHAGIEHYRRTRMLNDDPAYIAALASMVRRHLEETEP